MGQSYFQRQRQVQRELTRCQVIRWLRPEQRERQLNPLSKKAASKSRTKARKREKEEQKVAAEQQAIKKQQAELDS